jgi:hypothetical protein
LDLMFISKLNIVFILLYDLFARCWLVITIAIPRYEYLQSLLEQLSTRSPFSHATVKGKFAVPTSVRPSEDRWGLIPESWCLQLLRIILPLISLLRSTVFQPQRSRSAIPLVPAVPSSSRSLPHPPHRINLWDVDGHPFLRHSADFLAWPIGG